MRLQCQRGKLREITAKGWIEAGIVNGKQLRTCASPDLGTAFYDPGATQNRFQVTYDCTSPCKLSATPHSATLNAIRLISLVSLPSIGEPQPISEENIAIFNRYWQFLNFPLPFRRLRRRRSSPVVLHQGGRQRVAGFSGRRRSCGYCIEIATNCASALVTSRCDARAMVDVH